MTVYKYMHIPPGCLRRAMTLEFIEIAKGKINLLLFLVVAHICLDRLLETPPLQYSLMESGHQRSNDGEKCQVISYFLETS